MTTPDPTASRLAALELQVAEVRDMVQQCLAILAENERRAHGWLERHRAEQAAAEAAKAESEEA
jgi:hypothetical protein